MGKSTWVVDGSHSLVEFSVKHMMIATVKGRFKQVAGQIEADPADLSSASFGGSVAVASIDTGDEQRDGHLRSGDFFEADSFPTLTFSGRRVDPAGDDWKLVGDLTIRGVTRPVTWTLTYEGTGKDPWGNERIGFAAETKIDRREWGLTWNAVLEAGGVLVGEQVKVAVHLEAIKQG